MTELTILAAGPGATLQDGGRHGFLRWGVTVAGPMDPIAHATAALAVGNRPGATAIEVTLGGLEIAVDAPLDVAVAGGDFAVTLDGRPLAAAVALRLDPGRRLAVRPGGAGMWSYVAVGGEIDVPPILGSRATHTRSGLGGLDGRMLAAGDRLRIAAPRAGLGAPAVPVAAWLRTDERPIRVVLGPQDDAFAADQIAAFLDRVWRVSPRSDRMAYGLEGEPLVHAHGHDIVSDGVAHGSIQVPGSGLPFVLMADRQPTGGYPKIATVIGADLGRMAQLRPGAPVRFRAVTIAEAVTARRALADALADAPPCEPLLRTDLSSEFLLSCNLVSAWGA